MQTAHHNSLDERTNLSAILRQSSRLAKQLVLTWFKKDKCHWNFSYTLFSLLLMMSLCASDFQEPFSKTHIPVSRVVVSFHQRKQQYCKVSDEILENLQFPIHLVFQATANVRKLCFCLVSNIWEINCTQICTTRKNCNGIVAMILPLKYRYPSF